MTNKPTFSELETRIHAIAEFNGGTLPRDDAISWGGYIAGLLEWSLIDAGEHGRLQEMLGAESAAPTLAIFLGPEEAKAVLEREGAMAAS